MSSSSASLSSSPVTEDFFQQLADGAPVMIWMSGLDMGCYYFNRAWLDFRGRTTAQEAGNGWAEGVHPEDLQRCVSHYVGCFERRMAFAMSYRLQNAAGDYIWILDRGAPHYLPDGTFAGFFGGCAEIETESAIARNAELGSSLAAMKDFARQIAATEASPSRAANAKLDVPLTTFARQVHEDHEARQRLLRHATDEMRQLAADMETYGNIPRGACLP
jgi:PAS domain S-box-containing protein